MSESTLARRSFLKSAEATAVLAPAATTLLNFSAGVAEASPVRGGPVRRSPNNGGYGPIVPDTRTDNPLGAPLLALPEGFTYTALSFTGTEMSDGHLTPGSHDGMAAFPGPSPDLVRLVCNHEPSPGATPGTDQLGDPDKLFDAGAAGGTTNVLYDIAANEVVEDHISLGGTIRNWAGGPTPWGSWLTCEENYDSGPNENHGFIFEVPSDLDGPVDPVPLTEMGRFVHEAVALDPVTGIVYETEDQGTAGFYRYVPNTPGVLGDDGHLQMLAIAVRPNDDTRSGQLVGRPLPVEWVDIDDPASSGTNALAVYDQGVAEGAATFARLEGAWYGDGSAFIASTSGGDAGTGQAWKYRPSGRDGGRLTLTFESPGADVLDSPDNICTTPGGSLMLCEDGGGTDWLRAIDQCGQIFDFGTNQLNGSEWCGATFSPDASTMFVNMQSPGITFAIQGPWDDGRL